MLFGKLKSASTSYLPHFRFLKTIDERAEDTTKDHYEVPIPLLSTKSDADRIEVHVGHAFDGHPLSAKEKKAFDLCRKLVESVGGWVRNADEKKEKNFL